MIIISQLTSTLASIVRRGEPYEYITHDDLITDDSFHAISSATTKTTAPKQLAAERQAQPQALIRGQIPHITRKRYDTVVRRENAVIPPPAAPAQKLPSMGTLYTIAD